jgi:hypothetical protein
MSNDGLSDTRHDQYYLQFATKATYDFILTRIGIEKLNSSNDRYFNDIIKYAKPDWVWDRAPINTDILADHGETDSKATRTCVAKAVAAHIKAAHNAAHNTKAFTFHNHLRDLVDRCLVDRSVFLSQDKND